MPETRESPRATSRERVRAIVGQRAPDRCGFWLGNPHPDTWPGYHAFFGSRDEPAIRQSLGDDLVWVCPELTPDTYRHPEGRAMFDLGGKKARHGQPGPLADCESVTDLDRYAWPDPDLLDFTGCLGALRATGDLYRASGMWTAFYHDVMNLLGMENYLIRMYTDPELVLAVTDRVCAFYYEANERYFDRAGDLIDAYFFGNDFGTQLDLIIGLEQFDRFILPWFQRFTDQAHRHGYQVILHSCGAIHRVIGRLIDAGVDALHPIQALARNMDAETLARDYGGRIAFVGGIDTQQLLVHGTPEQVRDEVHRVRGILEPHLIVSPSHEALLPNVPPENVVAMAQAAQD